jgi:hypothetical protein
LSRCPFASELCNAKKSQAKKPSQETPPLKEGRRSAERRTTGPHRKAMRRASFLLSPHAERTEAAGTSWSGRARLSAPHRGIRGFLGLGSARAALPGTTGCKREDPLRHQCSEHLAVRHAPDGTMPKPPASAVYRCAHENRSRSALRSTLAKGVPLRAGFWVGNGNGDGSQGQCRFIGDGIGEIGIGRPKVRRLPTRLGGRCGRQSLAFRREMIGFAATQPILGAHNSLIGRHSPA